MRFSATNLGDPFLLLINYFASELADDLRRLFLIRIATFYLIELQDFASKLHKIFRFNVY